MTSTGLAITVEVLFFCTSININVTGDVVCKWEAFYQITLPAMATTDQQHLHWCPMQRLMSVNGRCVKVVGVKLNKLACLLLHG